MMLQSTKVAGNLKDNLNELRRGAELESLRPFVKECCCFLPTANPDTAQITMEELKKLARAWKLHGMYSTVCVRCVLMLSAYTLHCFSSVNLKSSPRPTIPYPLPPSQPQNAAISGSCILM